MNISRIMLVLFLAVSGQIWSQTADAVRVISLSEAVEQALRTGDALVEVQAGLASSEATNKLAQAKNSFTVSTALGYGASQSYNNPSTNTAQSGTSTFVSPYYSPSLSTGSQVVVPTAAVGAETTDGILVQNPSVSVTAGTPMTSLTGSWSTGFESWPTDGSVRNVGTASAKLSQTLWNGYRGGPTQAAANKASYAYQVAELNANASRNAATLTVKQAFFTMLSAQENLKLLQFTLESWKKTLQITQAKFDQQVATAVDVLTAQVSVRSAELDLVNGQNALHTARQRLANLMGIDPNTMFQAAPEPDPTSPASTLQEAVALGLKNRIEPQIADLNAHSSEVDQALAVGSATPSVAVTGGVTNYLDLTASRSTLVGQLGVTLAAPLWDAGAAGSSSMQAEKTRLGYLTQIHQYNQSIPVDIQEGWNTWQVDLQRLDVAVDNKKAFDDQLEIVRVQFQTGAKALSDLLTAQTNASNADFGLLKAKINTQLAALQLQNLLGL